MKKIIFAMVAICFNLNALAQDDSTDNWVQHIGENGQIPDLPRQGPLLLQKNAISNEFINTFYNCINNDCYIKPQFEKNELDVLKLQQIGWWEEQERNDLNAIKIKFGGEEYEKNKPIGDELPVCVGCSQWKKIESRALKISRDGKGTFSCVANCVITRVNGNWVITDPHDGDTVIIYGATCNNCSFTIPSQDGRIIKVTSDKSFMTKLFCALGIGVGPVSITNPMCW